MAPTSRDIKTFMKASSEIFLEVARAMYPVREISGTAEARPIAPVLVENPSALTEQERSAIAEQYFGESGVASFLCTENPYSDRDNTSHPLLRLTSSLSDVMPTSLPVNHPMEKHPEATSRFGPPDGTLKIYDLPIADPRHYREQAETNEAFDAHNDGLGYAGLIATAALWLESAPLWGGYTTFTNLVARSLELADRDAEAFESLFHPDAISCIRPRGKGAIKVKAPILYVGPGNEPRAFLREASGEYRVSWTEGTTTANAQRWCRAAVRPFGYGTTFVHLMTPGEGVLIRNQHVIHSRTPFIDPGNRAGRVLARKWFVSDESHLPYRHAPRLEVSDGMIELLRDPNWRDMTDGEWTYDAETDRAVMESSTQ